MTLAAAPTREMRIRARDRWAIIAGLVGVIGAAWVYLFTIGRGMAAGMNGASMGAMGSMAGVHVWSVGEAGLMLAMWMVMMAAMMLPSAVPMTLVYAAIARKAAREAHPIAPIFVFVAGYIAVWCAFSLIATTAEYGLDRLTLLSSAMTVNSLWVGGALLVAAGLYELTSLKNACLVRCRSPAHSISRHWHKGPGGAAYTGMRLGVYCLGCCWVLMALLFVAGVMNLLWIAALAALVLLEKTMPFVHTGRRLVAGALVLAGVAALTGVIG